MRCPQSWPSYNTNFLLDSGISVLKPSTLAAPSLRVSWLYLQLCPSKMSSWNPWSTLQSREDRRGRGLAVTGPVSQQLPWAAPVWKQTRMMCGQRHVLSLGKFLEAWRSAWVLRKDG